MKNLFLLFFILGSFCSATFAQSLSDQEELDRLLNRFLEGASLNDAGMHDRFWAEDLIYTRSNGERVTKEEIMQSLRPNSSAPMSPKYYAEETDIRLFDDVAVIAFKLVAVPEGKAQGERMEFYNTGTFLKRDGEWKAIAWQATRIP
ncbi:MAG: DUF4440 domain-containing protein [Bacteroidetes bacterium]|jgi:hypothetical protein|nr:DUF4440 domain-containing protein [Bacteroidota bacterium]